LSGGHLSGSRMPGANIRIPLDRYRDYATKTRTVDFETLTKLSINQSIIIFNVA